jgi:hypothetical protein
MAKDANAKSAVLLARDPAIAVTFTLFIVLTDGQGHHLQRSRLVDESRSSARFPSVALVGDAIVRSLFDDSASEACPRSSACVSHASEVPEEFVGQERSRGWTWLRIHRG